MKKILVPMLIVAALAGSQFFRHSPDSPLVLSLAEKRTFRDAVNDRPEPSGPLIGCARALDKVAFVQKGEFHSSVNDPDVVGVLGEKTDQGLTGFYIINRKGSRFFRLLKPEKDMAGDYAYASKDILLDDEKGLAGNVTIDDRHDGNPPIQFTVPPLGAAIDQGQPDPAGIRALLWELTTRIREVRITLAGPGVAADGSAMSDACEAYNALYFCEQSLGLKAEASARMSRINPQQTEAEQEANCGGQRAPLQIGIH